MSVVPLPRPDPERMTPRAQAYLLWVGLRNLLLGTCAVFAPWSFRSASYRQIIGVAPGGLMAWGVVFLLVAVCSFTACGFRRPELARNALLASAVVTGVWTAGFLAAWVEGNLLGLTAPIVWGALTAKDLTVQRQPLRAPFEPLVREAVSRRKARRV